MIDGSPVYIGDTVHVLGIGSGMVIAVNADGGFTVRTGRGETTFRDGGYIGNQRRVYWADPLIVTPPKDRRLWRAYVTVAQHLYDQAANFYHLGELKEAGNVEKD